ncbi:DUF7133 domain-containing protein [Maribacter halichondriae]|uniref:DUF7133 domain-containing protein n=1 Tax=Maribacter halichondriae TaxID=2980554 RepID=UPI002358C682|nr:hypothetical protein [Maribacter sp. Hal144]
MRSPRIFHVTECLCSMVALWFFMACSDYETKVPEGFQIHPDFTLQLAAAEPLVFDPVDLQFDEHGRAYVLEMPGYPMRDAQSRLIELVDNNDDGLFEERIVLDDSLGIASAFLPYKNGFLVASPPNLLFVADTNGDGKVDMRKIVMEGFSTGNLQHNFNGLTYGIDNWIYAANGGNSGAPFLRANPRKHSKCTGVISSSIWKTKS